MQEIEPAETELVKKLVKSDWICLDIGANIGYYTVLMSSLAKIVYAFEAEPRNYAAIRYNTKDLYNVDARCCVVSDKDGWEQLYLCTGDYNGANGMHRIYPSKWCSDISIPIPSISLDTFMLGRVKPDFIKMDIEGAELGALKGMRHILETYHPIMIMEFHPMSIREYGADPTEVYHFMTNLGYSISLIPNEEPISYEDLYLGTRDQSGGRNILCQKK